ncbi:hypothetical protein ABH935_006933 [Catenulispora sp. GAS73]|uniref:hypothetical protein n=1 Tax=Catenulispora sp. GAS73 TaxID=3156269 RepID=UPI00351482B5
MRRSGPLPNPWPDPEPNPQRVDIDGGGVEGPPVGRDPITGPVGVVLCGGGGGVDFGGVVGCGCVGGCFEEGGGAGVLAEDEDGCESLMEPPLGRSLGDVPSCASGSPLGRSVSLEPAPVEEIAALFVSCPGG